jgi:glycosyltransferase involved in cell wall biosynthesis
MPAAANRRRGRVAKQGPAGWAAAPAVLDFLPVRVAVIIPALDEEAALGATLAELAALRPALPPMDIVVVDNGSRDRTAEVARAAGARVVSEPRRGYGSACLAGIAALGDGAELVAFCDADGASDPAELPALLDPLVAGEADLAIGARARDRTEPGAMTPQQRFGNWLAARLLRLLYGIRATDLGPFRAIRREALERLGMRDTGFGWTIEMQIRAGRAALRVREVPVRFRRRRAGRSKISGTVRGTIGAGAKIIWTILRYRLGKPL